MSDSEEKMICSRCKGDGYIGYVEHKKVIYKKLCKKCYGICHIDWIQNITGINLHPLDIIISFEKYSIEKDNYVFINNGATFYVYKEFFNKSLTERDQWRHITMIANI